MKFLNFLRQFLFPTAAENCARGNHKFVFQKKLNEVTFANAYSEKCEYCMAVKHTYFSFDHSVKSTEYYNK